MPKINTRCIAAAFPVYVDIRQNAPHHSPMTFALATFTTTTTTASGGS